ncbi:hypothetical protein [Dyella sp.]|jgi:hypothetical protein|uniref:hypothetical protein n=1 Tax=Dyella sp. TaxID=1869338 RepID=UPI002D798172|nr:hypothetical protein [Dyella sp.]HET6431267.1 hypothetical protein [Dyella sp.]
MKVRQQPFGEHHPILSFLLLPFLVVGAAVAGLVAKPRRRAPGDVASTIRAFVEGTGSHREWDDFICGGRIADPALEKIRARCAALPREFPPQQSGEYCGSEGVELMRSFVAQLAAR